MKIQKNIIFPFMLLISSQIMAQGISRTSGIGLRACYWNITGRPTTINISQVSEQANVDVNGLGTWLYFFSRAYSDLFFELQIGAIAGVQVDSENAFTSNVHVESIMPILAGLRYDLFATRLSGSFHPYLSAGYGPYWSWTVETKDDMGMKTESINSMLKYGGFVGGGLNIVLASWIALNMDLKYHSIKFQPERDLSGLEFGLGFSVMWGAKRELLEVEEIKLIVTDVYPAYYQFYNTYPVALATVKNKAGYNIDVNVKAQIKGFSPRFKDSGFIQIEGGKTGDIPVTVYFDQNIQHLNARRPAILDLTIEARAAKNFTKVLSRQIFIHNRNAWDGDMDKLGFFLTPDAEEILELARSFTNWKPDSESDSRFLPAQDSLQEGSLKLEMARRIFNALQQKGIRYHPDPNIPFYQDDRVQYAVETLKLGTGDCDDLVVLYASFLESVGIKTAFVEVRDPEKQLAHLYLLCDSGVPLQQSYLISSNEKKFITREGSSAQQYVWIPVETTLIDRGFEAAWNSAALAFLQEGHLRNGLAEGWVRIIDQD